MPNPYWLEFLAGLPVEFPAFGQIIRLRKRDGHQLGVKVSPDPNPEPIKGAAGVVFFGTAYITLSAEEIRAFLSYYLNTSTGARLLTLGSNSTVNERRLFVFRAAMYSWAQLIQIEVESRAVIFGALGESEAELFSRQDFQTTGPRTLAAYLYGLCSTLESRPAILPAKPPSYRLG